MTAVSVYQNQSDKNVLCHIRQDVIKAQKHKCKHNITHSSLYIVYRFITDDDSNKWIDLIDLRKHVPDVCI